MVSKTLSFLFKLFGVLLVSVAMTGCQTPSYNQPYTPSGPTITDVIMTLSDTQVCNSAVLGYSKHKQEAKRRGLICDTLYTPTVSDESSSSTETASSTYTQSIASAPTEKLVSSGYLTSAQTKPYARTCAKSDKYLEGDYSFYQGIVLDDNTHSSWHGDSAREANRKIGDNKELFLVVLEQEFYDVRNVKKYKVTLCDFTIDEGIQSVHWNPGCDSLFKSYSFVSKKPASDDDFEEVLFYRDQLVIFDAKCV